MGIDLGRRPPSVAVTFRTRHDQRKFSRDLRAVEARIADVGDPDAIHFRNLRDPASVVRKAMGEFDA